MLLDSNPPIGDKGNAPQPEDEVIIRRPLNIINDARHKSGGRAVADDNERGQITVSKKCVLVVVAVETSAGRARVLAGQHSDHAAARGQSH